MRNGEPFAQANGYVGPTAQGMKKPVFRGIRFEVTIRRGKKSGRWVNGTAQSDACIRFTPSGAMRDPLRFLCGIP